MLKERVFSNCTIERVFSNCTTCNKKMKDICIPLLDREAIKQEEARERLCQKCAKESKHTDAVLDYELRKAGLIQ